MNADELGLRQAICDTPADDTPRLVLADKLDEMGDHARAEFIRVQVALAKPREPGWVPDERQIATIDIQQLQMLFDVNNHDREERLRGLRDRQRELVAADTRAPQLVSGVPAGWLVKLDTPANNVPGAFGKPVLLVSRGFPRVAVCTAADWLAHADSLFWSPGQTVCAVCGDKAKWPQRCSHYGTRVSRPFPETAQPISHVTLSTPPTVGPWGPLTWDGLNFTSEKWPGIQFTSPADVEYVATAGV